MTQSYQALYAEHVDEVQRRWEEALAAERFEAALVHSGTPIISFLDDYEYAFRPNPHFLHWLPLTHHADSALLIRPGRKPALFYYQPDDYWYLPPSDPESWWADHFNIEIVREADGWRQALRDRLAGESGAAAALAVIGDNATARHLAELLAEIPGIALDPATVDTNIVFFGLDDDAG